MPKEDLVVSLCCLSNRPAQLVLRCFRSGCGSVFRSWSGPERDHSVVCPVGQTAFPHPYDDVRRGGRVRLLDDLPPANQLRPGEVGDGLDLPEYLFDLLRQRWLIKQPASAYRRPIRGRTSMFARRCRFQPLGRQASPGRIVADYHALALRYPAGGSADGVSTESHSADRT
ncbi:MAG: hypothetical protein JWM57_517 [Phycisphaerales bacterium]|nr:hypothetical protein [Phycisphaerales bacterium]